jgi:D-arabinose 1-dehydrogenase-like Zn-dependent alcohol dehydrogenase
LSETVFVSTVAATRLDLQDALMLASMGALTVPIAARYPLEGVHDALDALRERRVLGRQVLELTG